MIFDNDYKQDEALSQSDIKLFEDDIRQFYSVKILGNPAEEKKSASIDVGNIVDAKILAPAELANYHVINDLKATGKVKDIIDAGFYNFKRLMAKMKIEVKDVYPDAADFPEWPQSMEWYTEQNHIVGSTDRAFLLNLQGILIETLTLAMDAQEYQTNWKKPNVRINKILELGKNYYDQLVAAGDKQIIHANQYNSAMSKVDSLSDDPYTCGLFEDLFTEKPSVYVHRQATLKGVFKDHPIKGKIDFYIQDDNAKLIFPWDLKTCDTHAQFLSNYRRFKYGRQGSIYSELLAQNYPGYTIRPFSFLVIPIASDELPEVYEMSPSELWIAANGYVYESGYAIKGWQQLIEEIQWHKGRDLWSHRRDYYNTGKNIINSKAILTSEIQNVANAF